jgi:hypothetical protein
MMLDADLSSAELGVHRALAELQRSELELQRERDEALLKAGSVISSEDRERLAQYFMPRKSFCFAVVDAAFTHSRSRILGTLLLQNRHVFLVE